MEDCATLKTCEVDETYYPVPLIANIFREAGYKLTDIGIDPKRFDWSNPLTLLILIKEVRQRLWLALVAILHDSVRW